MTPEIDIDAFIFIGPQGSGKGTQAHLLCEKLGFYYWGMGDILRETASQDTDFGRKIKNLIDAGHLLDDQTLLEAVQEKLDTLTKEKGIVFDAIPRRMGQAEFLLNHLAAIGKNRVATIFLDVTRDVSVERLMRRARIEGRADDTPEAINFRLKQYEEATVPVIDYLKTRTKFFDINGNPSVDVVTKEINAALGLS